MLNSLGFMKKEKCINYNHYALLDTQSLSSSLNKLRLYHKLGNQNESISSGKRILKIFHIAMQGPNKLV